MSDYLHNLVARTLNAAPVVQPRLASLFESGSTVVGTMGRASFETETPRDDPSGGPTLRAPTAISASVPAPQLQPRVKDKIEADAFDHKKAGADRDPGNHEVSPAVVVRHLSPLPATARLSAPVAGQELSPHLSALRIHEDAPPKAAAPQAASEPERLATERDREENWPQLQPGIRQLVDQQLTRLQSATPVDGGRSGREQSSPVTVATLRIPTQRQDHTTIKPTPHIVREPVATTEPAPTINVTIGRVEVRAIFPQPTAPRVSQRQPPTAMSLDEYLKRRNEGRR